MSRRILPVLFARSSESEYFVLNDEEFAEAERLGKVSLSEDHRIWIMQLLNANMDIAARELVSAKASAVYGALGEVERNAVALEQSLRAIEYDADIEVLRHALAKSHFRAVDITAKSLSGFAGRGMFTPAANAIFADTSKNTSKTRGLPEPSANASGKI